MRRLLVRRWLQLADDLEALADAIKNAPKGTFTPTELLRADYGLGQEVWNGMTNYRPRLPESPMRDDG